MEVFKQLNFLNYKYNTIHKKGSTHVEPFYFKDFIPSDIFHVMHRKL